MALDRGDRTRLKRIELELTASDPALASRFRRWRQPEETGTDRPGWSVASTWMLVVFLVGFTAWVVAPWLGGAVAVLGGCRLVVQRIRRDTARRARR